MDWLHTLPIAHRGLHDASRGLIENSPSAFEAAARAGYGIELDVHLSSDGEAIVFHDKDLKRLTTETGRVKDRSTAQLTQILLDGSADTIPTLGDVFDLVGGRVPLLIEIKSNSRRVGDMEARVAQLLHAYQGEAAVQSFNPYSMGWFAANARDVKRGQIADAFRKDPENPLPDIQRFLLRHMLLSAVSRPHFVAYDYKSLPAFGPTCARLFGLPVLTWTVKGAEVQRRIGKHADNIIFEGFKPAITDPTRSPAGND